MVVPKEKIKEKIKVKIKKIKKIKVKDLDGIKVSALHPFPHVPDNSAYCYQDGVLTAYKFPDSQI
jgi:hypothetical protein